MSANGPETAISEKEKREEGMLRMTYDAEDICLVDSLCTYVYMYTFMHMYVYIYA